MTNFLLESVFFIFNYDIGLYFVRSLTKNDVKVLLWILNEIKGLMVVSYLSARSSHVDHPNKCNNVVHFEHLYQRNDIIVRQTLPFRQAALCLFSTT